MSKMNEINSSPFNQVVLWDFGHDKCRHVHFFFQHWHQGPLIVVRIVFLENLHFVFLVKMSGHRENSVLEYANTDVASGQTQ